jgi:hypothetical protein
MIIVYVIVFYFIIVKNFLRKHILTCLRYLLGLENTPLGLLHCFICASTSRHYNPSLQSVLTLRYFVSGRYLDVLSFRRLDAD